MYKLMGNDFIFLYAKNSIEKKYDRAVYINNTIVHLVV